MVNYLLYFSAQCTPLLKALCVHVDEERVCIHFQTHINMHVQITVHLHDRHAEQGAAPASRPGRRRAAEVRFLTANRAHKLHFTAAAAEADHHECHYEGQ